MRISQLIIYNGSDIYLPVIYATHLFINFAHFMLLQWQLSLDALNLVKQLADVIEITL